jgi:hypothetical protein
VGQVVDLEGHRRSLDRETYWIPSRLRPLKPRSSPRPRLRPRPNQPRPPAGKKPGPAKRKDQEGRDILTARQTRRGDLSAEEERAAALASLLEDLDDDEPARPQEVDPEELARREALAARLRAAHPYWSEYEIHAAINAPRPDTTGEAAAPVQSHEAPPPPPRRRTWRSAGRLTASGLRS